MYILLEGKRGKPCQEKDFYIRRKWRGKIAGP